MIEYRTLNNPHRDSYRTIAVWKNQRLIGHINCHDHGWQYTPLDGKPGKFYTTLQHLKKSLEGED